MKIISVMVLLFLSLITPYFTVAFELNTGERVKISSDYLNEEREIQVLLPESYHNHPRSTYPVLYLLDGDYNFHGMSGVLDFLANKGQLIPDIILVSIADKGTEKYRQYMTPTKPSLSPSKKSGKSELFLRFLEKELKPYIQSHYRAAHHSILAGQSIGGAFVLNTLTESPNAFDHLIAVSPAVWANDYAVMDKTKTFIENREFAPVSLHLSLGDETRMGVYGILQLLDEAQPQNIRWRFSHYPDENHNSVGLVAIRDNLKTIFKGWFINDTQLSHTFTPEQLLTHYQSLLATLKINQPIPTPSIKSAIRYFYRQEQAAQIPVFLEKVKTALPASEQGFILMQATYAGHFDSPQAALSILLKTESRFAHAIEYLKSIAGVYSELGEAEKALSYYEKALDLAKKRQVNQWQLNIINAKILELKN